MSPKLSIIIPVYNVAPYLRECLDSVLAQTFTGWEAICVDDGSTDGSGEILDEYAAKDERFHIIHQANAGVSVARNVALDAAQGEWLTFADADDVLLADMLQNYKLLIEGNPDVDAFFFKDSIPFSDAPPTAAIGEFVVKEFLPSSCPGRLFWAREGVCGRPYLKLLRSNLYKSIKFSAGISFMEDRLNLIDVLAVKANRARVDVQTYGYRLRAGSASLSDPKRRAMHAVEVFDRMVAESIEKLGCDKSDIRRFWRGSYGVFKYYYQLAVRNDATRALAKECYRRISSRGGFYSAAIWQEALDFLGRMKRGLKGWAK